MSLADQSLSVQSENNLPEVTMANVDTLRAIDGSGNSVELPKENAQFAGTQISVSVAGVTATNMNTAIAELKANEDTLGSAKENVSNKKSVITDSETDYPNCKAVGDADALKANLSDFNNRRNTVQHTYVKAYSGYSVNDIVEKLYIRDRLQVTLSYTGTDFVSIDIQGYRNSTWERIQIVTSGTPTYDAYMTKEFSALRYLMSSSAGIGTLNVAFTITPFNEVNTIRNTERSTSIYGEGLFTIVGSFLKASDGTLSLNGTTNHTDYLEIDKKAGITVKGLSGTVAALVVFFDVSKAFISSISGSEKNNVEYYIDKSLIPSNCVYIVANGNVGQTNYVTAQTLASLRNYIDSKSLSTPGLYLAKKKGRFQFGDSLDFNSYTPNQSALLSETMTVAEIYTKYDALITAYPEYVSKIDCDAAMLLDGISKPAYLSGLNTYIYKFRPTYAPVLVDHSGTQNYNELKCFLVTGTHNEYIAINTLFNFMNWICTAWNTDKNAEELRFNVTFYILPASNLWGINNNSRGNFNGVDLNRNAPSADWAYADFGTNVYSGPTANSEYENKILTKYLGLVLPDTFVDFHNFGTDILGNNSYLSSRSQIGLDLCAEICSKITRIWKSGNTDYPQDTTTMLAWMRNPEEKGLRATYANEVGALSIIHETANGSCWLDGVKTGSRQMSALDALFNTESLQGFSHAVIRLLKEYVKTAYAKTYSI